jgi:UDP-N-acetylglucosamine 2-epimerase
MIHTGQHFDDELSAVFFSELGLPAPDLELGVSLGSNSSQTSRMLAALEPAIADLEPDAVLVYGDTNSTLPVTDSRARFATATSEEHRSNELA